MAGGIRVGSDGSGSDMGSASDLSALDDQPRIPPGLPEMDGSLPPPASPSSWLQDWMQSSPAGVEGMADQPPAPVAPPMPRDPSGFPPRARQAWNDGETAARQQRIDTMAKAQLPQTQAPKGPMLAGNVKGTQRPGTNPKTALPLYFAKAMGYAVPGESGDEEEARFAKAAHSALLKMTKGMSVAKFLASHQSPKTRDTFGRLLDAELAKGNKASPSVVDTPNPELAANQPAPSGG